MESLMWDSKFEWDLQNPNDRCNDATTEASMSLTVRSDICPAPCSTIQCESNHIGLKKKDL